MAIKVKQSTIDEIKKMGMTKALASAKTRRSPEFQEALRRMYGQRRLDAATKGAQGGSQPKETYMYRGTPGMKKKTTTGRSTPGAPAGTGARQVASRKKPTSRAGAIAASVAGAAGAGVVVKGTMEKRKIAAMNAKDKAKYLEERAKKVARRGAPIVKFSQTKAGKTIGKTARTLTGAAARRTAVGAVGLTAYELAKEARDKANKAGRKVQAPGSGRAAQMKKVQSARSKRMTGRRGK
jgi:hypothetical protein